MTEPEPEPRSPLAGGCVLLVLGGAAVGAVWAVSPDAAVLALWVAGASAVWWSARRVHGAANPAPPPGEGRPSSTDLHESRKAARGATDPNGVMSIVHAPGETTTD